MKLKKSSESIKTGSALTYLIALIVAINVIDGTITSSPLVTLIALKARCSAEVPLFKAIQYFALV